MKKAIFFDIDGTLISVDKSMTVPTAASKDAIKKAQREGHYTFIASGRPLGFIDQSIIDVGFDGLVEMNGAVVRLGRDIIYERTLPHDIVLEIIRLAEENSVEYNLQTVDGIYTNSSFERLDAFYRGIDMRQDYFIYVEDLTSVQNVCKLELMSADGNNESFFRKCLALPNLTGIMDVAHGCTMEIYSKHETKATGVAKALEALHIPVEHSYAFGDGVNDIEMMAYVGHPLVMGNANEALKPYAEVIVPTVCEDGVAWGIEHCVLQS